MRTYLLIIFLFSAQTFSIDILFTACPKLYQNITQATSDYAHGQKTEFSIRDKSRLHKPTPKQIAELKELLENAITQFLKTLKTPKKIELVIQDEYENIGALIEANKFYFTFSNIFSAKDAQVIKKNPEYLKAIAYHELAHFIFEGNLSPEFKNHMVTLEKDMAQLKKEYKDLFKEASKIKENLDLIKSLKGATEEDVQKIESELDLGMDLEDLVEGKYKQIDKAHTRILDFKEACSELFSDCSSVYFTNNPEVASRTISDKKSSEARNFEGATKNESDKTHHFFSQTRKHVWANYLSKPKYQKNPIVLKKIIDAINSELNYLITNPQSLKLSVKELNDRMDAAIDREFK